METIYLYNGFLMDETGDNFIAFQPGFKSAKAAQEWCNINELEYRVIAAKRVGDHLEPR